MKLNSFVGLLVLHITDDSNLSVIFNLKKKKKKKNAGVCLNIKDKVGKKGVKLNK